MLTFEISLFRRSDIRLHWIVSLYVTGDKVLIDDACQFAWIQLLRRQPGRDNIFRWLRTVATSESWRLYHDTCKALPFAYINEDRELANNGMEARVQACAIVHASFRLTKRQCETILLLVHGFSYAEIGSIRNVAYTTVNRHLVRGRRNRRLVLKS